MRLSPIYLDNHATTRVDPRVVAAMLPYFDVCYGNAGSITHAWGNEARNAVEVARTSIAADIGAEDRDIIFTSGATESNNLAILGTVDNPRARGKHVISVTTEHRAVLDPLQKLARAGVEVTRLTVAPHSATNPGCLDLQELEQALRPDTALVTVMLANNEIGNLQPLALIGSLCRDRQIPLHTDATQAVGKIPVDVRTLKVDLMSFSAHKLHGPKGVGGLYIRRQNRSLRLTPMLVGGGQEWGLRSGTLNVPGIVGLAEALRLCMNELPSEMPRLAELRARLFQGLEAAIPDVRLNGPDWRVGHSRLPGNLNVAFGGLDGETLMLHTPELALASGSACSAAHPEPSHVLRALGSDDDRIRSSLRFGLGRFNTADEIDRAVQLLGDAAARLREGL